jgi:cell division septation protein DedD
VVAAGKSTQSLPVGAESAPDAVTGTSGVPGREEYLLQTSSFRESASARAASEELKARGIPSFFKYYKTGADGGWYRVYAGPYAELSAAMQAAPTLETTLGGKPLLRRRPIN